MEILEEKLLLYFENILQYFRASAAKYFFFNFQNIFIIIRKVKIHEYYRKG